jgi:hypothetical protein
MNKYQFYISFNTKPGTASSKAIDDCTAILSSLGYLNFNLAVKTGSRFYFFSVLAAVLKLVAGVQPHSIVAIQYPLLSGNKLFKYIIRMLHARNIQVIAIVHDLNDLRYPQPAGSSSYADAALLNDYDYIIAHNNSMISWLQSQGLERPVYPLEIFDYLSALETPVEDMERPFTRSVVYAGNLSKSTFIYALDSIAGWKFNLYGPNVQLSELTGKENLHWGGALSADEILTGMDGSFGLLWDGADIHRLDGIYGNYLRFNNPHKLSLYLAAGLPVIVPEDSAMANFVKTKQLGLTIHTLQDLNDLEISNAQYQLYKTNACHTGKELTKGFYLKKSINAAENYLSGLSRRKLL